ncbi:hypothetical protein B0H16DRAFT_1457511 [Mycena metata]|uniref:Uncharacterized protein n=1 Tax=Mycena metata TaxID=1033252 RepID=A0AAD7NFE8_9AGAR|nr:hypothetical protein B0H16DRAFT_1457511 [Mycena metata]
MSAAPWSAEGGPDIARATRTLAPAPVSVGEEGDINSEEHIAGDAPPTGTDVIQLGPEVIVCEPSGGTVRHPRKDLAKDGVGKLANTTQQRVQLGELLASCRISGPCESDKAVGGDFHRYCLGVLSGRGFIVGGIHSEKLDGKRGQSIPDYGRKHAHLTVASDRAWWWTETLHPPHKVLKYRSCALCTEERTNSPGAAGIGMAKFLMEQRTRGITKNQKPVPQ